MIAPEQTRSEAASGRASLAWSRTTGASCRGSVGPARLGQRRQSGVPVRDPRRCDSQPNLYLLGRQSERFAHHHEGVPVYGADADLVRQTDGGVATAIFGTPFTDIDAWVSQVPEVPDHAVVARSLVQSANDLFGTNGLSTWALTGALRAVGIPAMTKDNIHHGDCQKMKSRLHASTNPFRVHAKITSLKWL